MRVENIGNNYTPVTGDTTVNQKPVGKGTIGNGGMNNPLEAQQGEYSSQKLEMAVDQLNKTMETYGTELKFTIHKESGEVLVKVINTKDDSVIREIPPERVLDFIGRIKKMLGIIFDKFI